MQNLHPVLVTGGIRSGTTWVGKILAQAQGVAYYEEPFNPLNGPFFGTDLPHDFVHIHKGNEHSLSGGIRSAIGLSYTGADLQRRLNFAPNLRHKAVTLKDFLSYNFRFGNRRPIIKDPMALYSAEWLAESFGVQPLVLIRHPAAFIQSLNRLGWGFDFNWFLQQPRLMELFLQPFREQLEQIKKTESDSIDRGILAWNIVHHVVFLYREKHPGWLFYRHEDLSADPENQFKDIFQKLNLPFSSRVSKQIIRSTHTQNPAEAPEGVIHSLLRNSLQNITTWKRKLSDHDVERIRKGTEAVSAHFYSASDW